MRGRIEADRDGADSTPRRWSAPRAGFPLVLLDPGMRAWLRLDLDRQHGGAAAVTHLVDLGHRASPRSRPGAELGRPAPARGLRKALVARASVPIRRSSQRDFTEPSGYTACAAARAPAASDGDLRRNDYMAIGR